MKITREEIFTFKMSHNEVYSLMFYLRRGGTKSLLSEFDASEASKMYNTIQELVKSESK